MIQISNMAHNSNSQSQYDRQESRATTRTNSSIRRVRKSVVKGVTGWLGLDEDESERLKKKEERWMNRRKRYASSIGMLKEDVIPPKDGLDELDFGHSIRDPLRRPDLKSGSSVGVGMSRRSFRKSSVALMTIKGIGNFVGARNKVRRATHTRPGSQATEDAGPSLHGEEFSLVDDVFYDDKSVGHSAGLRLAPISEGPGVDSTAMQAAPAPGWRRRPPPPFPDTPGAEAVDQPDFAMKRITEKVLDTALRRDKRVMGVGMVGRFFRPSIRSGTFTKDVKQQLDEMDDHRPYFTYWVTFVQLVVYIVAVAVYGTAPFGIGKHTEQQMVRLSNLAREVRSYVEQENIWFGPRQVDLIHLGAKYSPCMRVDLNLQKSLDYDRYEEKVSACCVRNDGSGCVQRPQKNCDSLSTWKKWEVGNQGPGGRLSGTVCGQDPQFCITPSSVAPFEWPDSIVEWPLCTDTRKPNVSLGSRLDRHMSCEILGRPCCHGIQGECFITTREHCDLLRGKFHLDKYLCSQTQCFQQICGMIPFANSEVPDQFYRLWTSLFLHGGLVHLIVTIAFQMWLMRDMEKLIGAIRMAIIYIGSGIAGNLGSCTFLPYQVEVGPSGSQFGILACLLVEVIQSYQMYRRPHIAILKLAAPIFVLFLFGLLPWFDNWAHLFGFLFGFLLAFALMPYVSFGKGDRTRKIITLLVCFGVAVGLFVILVLIFYVAPLTECDFCHYFNCIPFTSDFCENMQVNLKKNSTYSKYF